MTFPLALNQSDYETLVAYARKGTLNPDGTINQDSSNGLAKRHHTLRRLGAVAGAGRTVASRYNLP